MILAWLVMVLRRLSPARTSLPPIRSDFFERAPGSSSPPIWEGTTDIYLLTRNPSTRLDRRSGHGRVAGPGREGEDHRLHLEPGRELRHLHSWTWRAGRVRRLTSDSRDEVSPSWSADGAFVYYDLEVKEELVADDETGSSGPGVSAPLFSEPPLQQHDRRFSRARRGRDLFHGQGVPRLARGQIQ